MSNAISEIGFLIMDSSWKVISLSMLLFVSSMIMKYNYYQKTPFWFVTIILIFNFVGGYGTMFFMWYILGGLRGHFIPRGMPAFPYLYTQPKINNINYLVTPPDCNVKDFPTIPEEKMTYTQQPRNNWIFNNFISKVFSPAGNIDDNDIFNANGQNKNARVDNLIFGDRDGQKNEPCDRAYLGSYRLNEW